MERTTSTKKTNWLDNIYRKSFDCSMYLRTRVEVKTFNFILGEEIL